MNRIRSSYDVVIIGAGHNGLVAACYLAGAGLSVLILEKNSEIGGATKSARIFPGIDARLSVYSYLISLFPEKIAGDLGLNLDLRRRRIASYTPQIRKEDGGLDELLVSNESTEVTRDSFVALTGNDRDFRGYRKIQEMQQHLADLIWPTLLEPLPGRSELAGRIDSAETEEAWRSLIEEPLGQVIEKQISDDLIRGMLFTDAKIGVSTWPDDPSLLQNRTFLYHIIGRGTGEWRTPAGGMGALVEQLKTRAVESGAQLVTGADVRSIGPGRKKSAVCFKVDGKAAEVDAGFVLSNAASQILSGLLDRNSSAGRKRENEGSVFKINMLLQRLPQMRSEKVPAEDAFAGTFHIDEGYDRMTANFRETEAGILPERPACEIYCHSLTDDSILSDDLRRCSWHTLTCFGLDAPFHLFEKNNAPLRSRLLDDTIRGINRFLDEPLEECFATDGNGNPCVEIKTPVDLRDEIHLPRGNIFHNGLSWPFADEDEKSGRWGVETGHDRIYICGSSASRGGGVSGIPGHNAAMKVLDELGMR